MAHGHTHGHTHGHAAGRAGARHVRPLRWSFAVVAGFLVVQAVTGLVTGSLALLSDAGHMATDALGLGMALAAIGVASRPTRAGHRTFGLYRVEILAALGNAVLLFGVAAFVIVAAGFRLDDPPDIAAEPVLLVATLGLGVNLLAFFLLRDGAAESLNVRGAYLEVVADALGSIAVIVATAAMAITGWGWIDPVAGAAIGAFILPRAWRLGRSALRVLIQAAPEGMDVDDLRGALGEIPGVADVHDLHVWTLTSEMDVLTAHLTLCSDASSQPVLDAARLVLVERFGVDHATLQVEHGPTVQCEEITW